MFGSPSDAGSTVPCNFRIDVHEATHVPSGVKSLAVTWRKGAKVVSTGQAEVQEGRRVQWWDPIRVSCLLFRVGPVRDGNVYFESKLCWLAVTGDDGECLGHVQLDLANFCDGQVHDRVFQVNQGAKKGARPAMIQDIVQPMQLRVTIEASQGLQGGPRPVVRKRERLGSTSSVASARLPPSPRVSRISREDSALPPDLEVLLRGANQSPGNPLQMKFRSQILRSRTSVLGGTPASPKADLPSSRFGCLLEDLPTRLVALTIRQCMASGLSSVQREDAIRLFVSALRRTDESSSGILFSTAPMRPTSAIEAAAAAASPSNAGAPDVSVPTHNPQTSVPDSAAGVDVTDGVAASDAAPAVPMVGMHFSQPPPPVAVHGVSHACTRDLYELMSHLSDIRSLALSLPLVAAEQGTPLSGPFLGSPEVETSPTLPPGAEISAMITEAAANFAEGGEPAAEPASCVDGSDAAAGGLACENPDGGASGCLAGDGIVGDGARVAEVGLVAPGTSESIHGGEPAVGFAGAWAPGESEPLQAGTPVGVGSVVAPGASVVAPGASEAVNAAAPIIGIGSGVTPGASDSVNAVAPVGGIGSVVAPGASESVNAGMPIVAVGAAVAPGASDAVCAGEPDAGGGPVVAAGGTEPMHDDAMVSPLRLPSIPSARNVSDSGPDSASLVRRPSHLSMDMVRRKSHTPADMVISQILQGVDEAASICERALQDASVELGDLLFRLSEISRDRELWAHRFFAIRELQVSARLCERAYRLDTSNAPPVVVV